jgi:hypothetical protein
MSKTKKNAIIQAAISELEKLSLSLDTELEVVANMPIEEVEEDLRKMGLDPNQRLPERINRLISEESTGQQSLTTPNKAVKHTDNDASAQDVPSAFLSYSHIDTSQLVHWLEGPHKLSDDVHINLHVSDMAFSRAAYSLRDLDLAEKVTIEVADAFETWCKPAHLDLDTCYPSLSKVETNKLLLLDSLIFKKILPYKRQMELEHRTGVRQLDEDVIDIWFIEELMGFVLDHGFSYTAIGICDLLYGYDSNDVMRIYEALDPNSSLHPDVYRRRKRRILDALGRRLGKFLEFERAGDKKELHIKKPDDSSRIFWLIEDWLNWLTPPTPSSKLSDENFGLGAWANDSFYFLALVNRGSKDYLIERQRMHSLVNPHCFSNLVRSLNIPSPGQRLELPTFLLSSAKGQKWRHPFGKSTPQLLDQQRRERIDTELAQRRKRREEMNLNTVIVTVDGSEYGVVSLDHEHALHLRLKEGSGLIEFKGHDKEGSVPIGTHVLHWNEGSVGKEPEVYNINVLGKQILSYAIKYTRNARGDLNGVILENAIGATTA